MVAIPMLNYALTSFKKNLNNTQNNLRLATFPKNLKSSGIKWLLERALWERGVSYPLQKGAKRHACREVGMDADYVCKGETEEVMRNAEQHAVRDHYYKLEQIMTPDLRENKATY